MSYDSTSKIPALYRFEIVNMPRKTIVPNLDDLVAKYVAGASIDDICSQFSVSRAVLYRSFSEAGVVMRNAGRPKIELPTERLIEMFNSGVGISGIATYFKVAPNVIIRHLKLAGVPTRNRSEQQSARMATTAPDERKRLAQRANEAARGRVHSAEEKAQRALTNQTRSARISRYETQLFTMLVNRGIYPTTQHPIGPYNCDLAAHPVAVEVWGGHWHWTGKHAAITEERFRYLMNAGWHVMVVAVNNTSPLTAAVADYVASEIKLLRSDPSLVREYRVIWRAGEYTTRGCLEDNDFSVEPPFTYARDPATGRYKSVPR
ncbi:MAG: hypothetical protein CFE48_03740 [Pseudomonas sp. PGPPP2]|nr:MAG: hypothetical protein CFE48_03740 [Pseudomonas sp. PGPPP2]